MPVRAAARPFHRGLKDPSGANDGDQSGGQGSRKRRFSGLGQRRIGQRWQWQGRAGANSGSGGQEGAEKPQRSDDNVDRGRRGRDSGRDNSGRGAMVGRTTEAAAAIVTGAAAGVATDTLRATPAVILDASAASGVQTRRRRPAGPGRVMQEGAMTDQGKRRLRSQEWWDDYSEPDMTALYLERYLNYGLTREELQSGRPIIGIAQTGSDLAPCNRHHLQLASRVRDGIRDMGGIPIEFPVHPCRRPASGRRRCSTATSSTCRWSRSSTATRSTAWC